MDRDSYVRNLLLATALSGFLFPANGQEAPVGRRLESLRKPTSDERERALDHRAQIIRQSGMDTIRFVDSEQSLGDADSYCVSLGDMDADGDMDAIVANVGAPSRMWLNDGYAEFSDSGQELPSAECVAVADLDGDGDTDVFLSGEVGRVLTNDGRGNLTPTRQALGGPGGAGLALGDVDSDGDVDSVVSRWGHPAGLTTEIWLNDGKGGFQAGESPPSVEVSAHASLSDLDRDGDFDLLIANQSDSIHAPIPDEIWYNDGAGRFPGPVSRLGDACTYEIAPGDLNGDGWTDLFVANSSHAGKSDPANRVYFNDGTVNFLDSGQALGDTYSLSVALGDLDGDGDLDAYVGNWGADRVWVNDGRGRFSEAPLALGSQVGADVALADLDGDGDLDAFVVNAGWQGEQKPNRVWINVTRRDPRWDDGPSK